MTRAPQGVDPCPNEENATSSENEATLTYGGWRVVAASSAGVFFASLVVVAFPVLLKPLCSEFAWPREDVSKAFGIAAGVAALCAPPVGLLLDRVDPRRIVVASLAVFGVAFASLAWLTPSLAHLYLVFALLGAAGIGTSPVAYGRVVSTWFASKRGLALALVVAGGAVGGVVHPPVLAALVQRIGWRGACAALGIAVLAIGVPTALTVVRTHPSRRSRTAIFEGSSVGRGLRSTTFWALLASMVGATMVQNTVLVHLHALLTDRAISASSASSALAATAASAVAGRLATGWLIDRHSAGRVGAAMMVLAAIGVFLLSAPNSHAAALVGAMLVGFGTGAEADIVPYLLSRSFGLRSFSTLYGLAWMAGGIGGALGPILAGRTFDLEGSYASALTRLVLVALVTAVILFLLPRQHAAAEPRARDDAH